jgi:hypothetical protein
MVGFLPDVTNNKEYHLLENDTAWLLKEPIFWKNILHPSSE